jgi:hypothetical protein
MKYKRKLKPDLFVEYQNNYRAKIKKKIVIGVSPAVITMISIKISIINFCEIRPDSELS